MAAKRPQPQNQPKRPHPAAPQQRTAPGPRTPPAQLPPLAWSAYAIALVTLPLLAVLLYWPSLNGPFVYDDPNAISQSQLIRRLTPLRTFFELSTRPLTDYSYAINYAIAGLRPWTYHVTNLLLHVLNGLLLFVIATRTLAQPLLASRYGAARAAIAWVAAALFIAHPLASETVGYVSSRSEVLAAFWYLLTLLSYAVAATTRSQRSRRVNASLLPVWMTLAVLSKEIAFTAPAALLLFDWLFLAGGDLRRTATRWRLLGLVVLPLAGGGLFLLARAALSGQPMGEYGATAGFGFDRFTAGQYLMTQFGVILYYLRLVVLPFGQTFDYDWPLARSPFELGVLVPLLLLAGLVWLAWRWRRSQPIFSFAVFWTLVVLAPTSSVLPIADLAVERRMYIPLAALMLLAASALYDLAAMLMPRASAQAAWMHLSLALALMVPLATLTYWRAQLWGDAIALHEDGVAKAPGNPRVRLNLGVTYLNLRQRDKALVVLDQAKILYDRGESVHAFPRIGAFIQYNLGAVLFTHGEYDRAEVELKRSLQIGGQYLALRPMANMLLSRIDAMRDDWKGAAAHMEEALRYQEVAEWRFDLAEFQERAGNASAALATLTDAVRRYPNDPRAQEFRAKAVEAYRATEDRKRREKAAEKNP